MKRLFVFLFGIFICAIAIAEDITLNWGVDNQTYATTTCTVGGDVTLPTAPTKRGYTFYGWTAEHFNRGTFLDWANVPTNVSFYSEDFHGNKTPLENDYMVVEDTSDYSDVFPIDVAISEYGYGGWETWFYFTMGGETKNIQTGTVTFSNGVVVTVIGSSWGGRIIQINRRFKIGTNIYPKDTDYDLKQSVTSMKIESENPTVYDGVWRFVYHGVWGTNGKDGWKPDYQIIE